MVFTLKIKVIKSLTVIGTVAMILVGGGILVHNIPMVHDIAHFTNVGIINEGIVGIIGSIIVMGVAEILERTGTINLIKSYKIFKKKLSRFT